MRRLAWLAVVVAVGGCGGNGDGLDGTGSQPEGQDAAAETQGSPEDASTDSASPDALPSCPGAPCPYQPAGPVANCVPGAMCEGQPYDDGTCSRACEPIEQAHPLDEGTFWIRTPEVTGPQCECQEGLWLRWFLVAPKAHCVSIRGPESMGAHAVTDGETCLVETQGCARFQTGDISDKTLAVGLVGDSPVSLIRIDVVAGSCPSQWDCVSSCNGE